MFPPYFVPGKPPIASDQPFNMPQAVCLLRVVKGDDRGG